MIRTEYSFGNSAYPLIAFAIHNGHDMPSDLLEICGISEADRLREEDPYTEFIAKRFPNNICVFDSRFMVDLNRSFDKAVYLKPEDCWGLEARTAALPKELLTGLQNDYKEWYAVLEYQIERLLHTHKLLIVLDIHSYNHRRQGEGSAPDPQSENPDIIIGKSNMPEKYHLLVEHLRQRIDGKMLNGNPIDCRIDVKFSGGYLSRWLHQKYPLQVISLSLEFKKIFMNEWTGILNEEMFHSMAELFVDCTKEWLQSDLGIGTSN